MRDNSCLMQQITQKITRSAPKAIQTTQDIGYYALGGPNLCKIYVPCTFEFLISATPYLKTHHLGVSLGGHDGKTSIAGAPGRGVHRASVRPGTTGLRT
jgi:hypothetical protein